jgi:hypothetical protein
MSLLSRIACAEHALSILRPGLRIISILGGLKDDSTGDFARIDGLSMARADGETSEDFRARARAAAIDAAARTLIYGGLPPLGMDGNDDRQRIKPKETD